MKQVKGEAAFESIDEVLAGKIVTNSKKHGQEKEEKKPPSSPKETGIPPDAKQDTGRSSSKNYWILTVVFASMILILGCVLFGKCKECCKKMRR